MVDCTVEVAQKDVLSFPNSPDKYTKSIIQCPLGMNKHKIPVEDAPYSNPLHTLEIITYNLNKNYSAFSKQNC